ARDRDDGDGQRRAARRRAPRGGRRPPDRAGRGDKRGLGHAGVRGAGRARRRGAAASRAARRDPAPGRGRARPRAGRGRIVSATTTTGTGLPEEDFEYLRDLMHLRAAIVLEQGKEYLALSRLEPVARDHGLTTVSQLVDLLRT